MPKRPTEVKQRVKRADVALEAGVSTATVSYVRDNGLMNGTSDTAFSPDGTMTRARLVTALHRAAGTPSVPMQPSYTDVPAAAWYSDAAAWAALEGLAGGYGDGGFGPDDLNFGK